MGFSLSAVTNERMLMGRQPPIVSPPITGKMMPVM